MINAAMPRPDDQPLPDEFKRGVPHPFQSLKQMPQARGNEGAYSDDKGTIVGPCAQLRSNTAPGLTARESTHQLGTDPQRGAPRERPPSPTSETSACKRDAEAGPSVGCIRRRSSKE